MKRECDDMKKKIIAGLAVLLCGSVLLQQGYVGAQNTTEKEPESVSSQERQRRETISAVIWTICIGMVRRPMGLILLRREWKYGSGCIGKSASLPG